MHNLHDRLEKYRLNKNIFSKIFESNDVHICVYLFVAALILRIIGIHYGYWLGDERINDAVKVLTGIFVPEQLFYPPLFNYIMAAFFGFVYVVGRLVPVWHDTADFRAQYFADPVVFYLTARFVTALLGAAVAPTFYLIARTLGLARIPSVTVGILGVIIPVGVYLSHIAKSDLPLATMIPLIFYLLLLKYQNSENLWTDILLGLSVSLAFSFKHSFIFMAVPLAIGHLYWMIATYDRPVVIKSILISGLVCLFSWVIFNIAFLLNFEDFLAYQAIQSQIAVRASDAFVDGVATWLAITIDNARGITAISTLIFFLFPLYLHSRFCDLSQKGPLTIFWGATVAGTIILIILAGVRQQEGLWVPYYTSMQLFTGLFIADLLRSPTPQFRYVGAFAMSVMVLFCLMGVVTILQQALARPIAGDVAPFVRSEFGQRRILTSFKLGLPQQKEAQDLEISRDERLADKYHIELPERSAENIIKTSAPGSTFYVKMPKFLHGIEVTDDKSMEGIVQAHSWPLQKEEWKLDYWLNKGFSVWVVVAFEYYSQENPSATLRNFYLDMARRCKLARHFEAIKPMLGESSVRVFDCAMHPQ
jgi:hypothetical protein